MEYCYFYMLGLACTPEALLRVEDLSQQDSTFPAETNRQWIFPSLRFTCTVNVTAWVFTVGAADADVVCPTLELWKDETSTPSPTDYTQIQLLTSSSYAQPEALSESVYRCNLITPLRVSAGTVLGFQTRSQNDNGMSRSNVQLLNTSNAQVGYYRNVARKTTFLNTAQNDEFTGSVPLITPETDMQFTTEILTPSIISPGSTSTTPLSAPPSIPDLSTPTPTAISDNPATDNSESTTPVIVGIVVTTSILLLIAAIVLVLLAILLARHRRQASPQASKTTGGNGTTVPGTTKTEIKQVCSKNNYTFTSSHIYEPVDGGATMPVQEKMQQHDYDFIASVSIGPTGDPENYEIPQTSPSRTSSTPDNSVYEVPGTIVDQYATPVGGPDLVREGTSMEDCTYDTPVDARGPIQVNVSVGEGGYDTLVDAQVLTRGNTEAEESIYETPVDAGQGDTESSDVYECV